MINMCTIYDPYLQIFSPHQEQHPVSAGLLGDAAQSLRDVRGRHLGDGTAWHHGTFVASSEVSPVTPGEGHPRRGREDLVDVAT